MMLTSTGPVFSSPEARVEEAFRPSNGYLHVSIEASLSMAKR